MAKHHCDKNEDWTDLWKQLRWITGRIWFLIGGLTVLSALSVYLVESSGARIEANMQEIKELKKEDVDIGKIIARMDENLKALREKSHTE